MTATLLERARRSMHHVQRTALEALRAQHEERRRVAWLDKHLRTKK